MSDRDFDFHSTAEEVTEGIDLTGQTWLLTGVNSGLGYESARVLALRGASIIGLARTEAKATRALSELDIGGTGVACELSDLDSVRAAVARVRELAPLNGIMANAGIMALPELEQVNGIERQFFTNHVGHFVLVTGLLDRLEEHGRIVILSSGAHRMAEGLELDNLSGEKNYQPWRQYGRSKLANIHFAKGLTERLDGGRTANALHPGVIQTNLARHIPDPETMFESLKNRLKTIPQGAATQCWAATAPELEGVSGEYFSDCGTAPTRPEVLDKKDTERLWQVTEEIAG